MMELALDPLFAQAVAAIDDGDERALGRLIEAHPDLLSRRAATGGGYFTNPYLLWFVAGNPVRTESLPSNISTITRQIVDAACKHRVETLQLQLDYTLTLVASGRVARESGVQRELIDLLVDAGASTDCVTTALANGETDAAKRLLEKGAPLTLLAAAVLGTTVDVLRLLPDSTRHDRQLALIGAALSGRADAVRALLASDVDLNAFGPDGFHPHATPLHQGVYSGSLAVVKTLVEAGADFRVRDRIYQGTALGWADHLKQGEIAAYLRARGAVD